MRSSWRTNSPCGNFTRKPGIDSSLSSVPPVCPRPRPDILPNTAPQAATSGASTSVTLSPTPPLECLSSTGRRTTPQVEQLAALHHGARQIDGLRVVEAAQHHGHEQGAGLVRRARRRSTTPSTNACRRPASRRLPSRFQAMTSFTKSTQASSRSGRTRGRASAPPRRRRARRRGRRRRGAPRASTSSWEPTSAARLATSASRQQAAPAARAARTSGAADMPTTSP